MSNAKIFRFFLLTRKYTDKQMHGQSVSIKITIKRGNCECIAT